MLFSCKNEPEKQLEEQLTGTSLQLKYAKGFTVKDHGNHKILTISQPWPEAKKTYKYVFINTPEAFDSIEASQFDFTFTKDIKRIVVTSTTHIPALELLGVEEHLVGFPETNYISSAKTRALIDRGKIIELGKNQSINTEVLLALNPDVVVGFGVDGVNKTFETIKKAGIPVIYNGDWTEGSALAKAEWIKLFGVLFNKEKKADSIFNTIEKNYLEAKQMAQQATNKPTIFSGALYKDVWYLPNGSSAEAQFLNDANTNYLWKDSQGNGSLALSFESVFEKAQHADIWLSPSYYTSREQLQSANDLYTKFDAFSNQKIYSFSNTVGDTGGVLYYELGTARPDLILKDIIKICHPDVLDNYEPFFFKPLE